MLVQDDLSTLREENRRLRGLVEFARHVTAERDPRTQVRMLCDELASMTGCRAGVVVARHPERGCIETVEVCGLSDTAASELARRIRHAGSVPDLPTDHVIDLDEPTLSSIADVLADAGIQRVVAAPLAVGDDTLGIVLALDPDPNGDSDCLRPLADAAAMAMQNTRLHADSHRELRHRDALRAVIASISSELDLDSLLERVVGSAVELFDADRGIISFVDADGSAHIRAAHHLPHDIVGRKVAVGEGVTGHVLATRAAVLVERYADVPRPLERGLSLGAAIGVPIWWQEQLIGVFCVFAAQPGRVFDTLDREVMELLADHAAIAIENARLYGEVRERLAEVTGLQAASAALAEELQPQRALRALAEQALALSGAATVTIELLRSGSGELEVQVAVGENAVEDSDALISRPLVLPLRARGRTLGILSAYTRAPRTFQSRQKDLLATFANQAAISLDNARLYGELQSRLEEMVGLQRLGTLLLEEHDFDRVLQSICEQLQRLTDAGGVGLALLEDDPRYLEMRTVVGPSAGVLRGMRIPTDASFAAEALRTNRPQRSDDAQNDPRGYKKSLILGNTRTILSVPMKTRRRTVGVLSVYNKQGAGGFTDRDAELATFFANQAAAAIENARLYEQTREYAVVEERNRLARELHDSVTQSLFSVTLLSEAALNLLDRDPGKARERLERANELAQGALAEMRALIFQLRPMTLQEEGLLSAVKKHLAAVHSRHGQLVELNVTGTSRRLQGGVEDAAFRIVQEALNNIIKHAQAQRAQVELQFRPDLLLVRITDDGVGFDPSLPPRADALGMSSMRERAEAIGGRLSVQSAPGQGTRVSAELPATDAD